MGRQPHVLVIPYPAQGHAGPLMKLSTKIAEQGVKVTFVSTEVMQAKIKAPLSEKSEESSGVTTVLIQYELGSTGDAENVRQSRLRLMTGRLKTLIEKINESNDREQSISCLVADVTVGGWALDIAEQMGIAKAAVIPYGPGPLALSLHIPKLMVAGKVDTNGNGTDDESILLPGQALAWKKDEFPWTFRGLPNVQKIAFEISAGLLHSVKNSNWVLNNSVYELDSASCDLIPDFLTIGPLLTSTHSDHSAINFWPQDSTCLTWLDKQATASVVYVAFGSIAILSQQQFEELALGLESLQQPFLWVVRQDLINGSPAKLPDGFTERVSDRGKIVEWAPQEKVLGHSSVACFLSHCGWNSTMEGLSMGVPFLCWPYFFDQYQNKNYICDVWRVGLQLSKNENGIITSQEIVERAKKLLGDDDIKASSLKLKEMVMKSLDQGGSSFLNFKKFISQIQTL